jgi:hypothetical protein
MGRSSITVVYNIYYRAVGVVLGAATPEPCKLVHPLALLLPYKLQLFEQLLKQLIHRTP